MIAQQDARERLRGIALLVLSSCLFGCVDGLSKILSDHQSVAQIVWARYALALPVLFATTAPRQWTSLFRTGRPGLQVLRGLAPLVISSTMVLAVRNLPLAEATVILFAGPFLVVALSGPMLGEKVPVASWIGVVVGFLAVLIVARPGFGTLSVAVVYPLIAAVFYALFQIFTRKLAAGGETPSGTLAWTLAVGVAISTPFVIWTWEPLDAAHTWLMLGLGLVFGIAQVLMIRAFGLAPAGVLAPFTYAQIIAATVFGVLVFGAVPDLWTLLGIVMIIAAGVYVVRSRGD
jgi:drug/metabolite transporter (DMT)-like permease